MNFYSRTLQSAAAFYIKNVYRKKWNLERCYLKNGTNINALDEDNQTPLHYACYAGNVAKVELLLKMGADVHISQNGRTLLHEMCLQDKVECAEILLKYGANINAVDESNETPLHGACYKGNAACTEFLLMMGADVHTPQSPCTPLDTACQQDKVKCAEILIKYGANINPLNGGVTPLLFACFNGSISCMDLLLKMGANVRIPPGLTTPLHVACKEDKVECAEMLIKYGVNINAVDSWDKTPVHYAFENGSVACVELFLKMGADVDALINTTTQFHGTALHIAAMQNDLEMAEVLIEYGANVYARNNQNKLPIDLLPQKEGGLFDLLVESTAQPVSLKDLCRQQIRATLVINNRLKSLPNLNIPRQLQLYLMHGA